MPASSRSSPLSNRRPLKVPTRKLHEIEGKGEAEARSHGIQYQSPGGRRDAAHSPSPRHSVLGEAFIDNAMDNVRKDGVGHLGNFYWLPRKKPGHVATCEIIGIEI